MGMAAGFAAALAACGGSSGGSGASGAGSANPDGTITAGISYELGTSGYDPMTTTAGLTVAANWHTLEGLTELDAVSREAYAALGKDLPMKVDDTTYEVALRDGAKFSDGSDVTVEDVVFSFERVLDPANNSLYSQFLTFLESVTAKDDTTVTIKTKHPYSLVAERLSTVKIVPKAVVEADPKAFDMNPIGSGPYKMTDNSAASQTVVFERNDNYNGSHPALAKKMTWQVLPDDTTRTNAITSSTVQAIDTVPATNLSAMTDPVVVSADKGFSLVFVMFNHQGAFADVKARQAIMYALDYEKICSTGMGTLATAATCFVQEDHPAYKQASTVYTYDAAKAKSLLAEAGITSIEAIATDHGFFSGARPIIKENLEANLRLIEDSLGKSLRQYFVKDFYKDHCRRYSNRPIYWMISSRRDSKASFQALIYLHRYTPDTLNTVLGDYLREFQAKLRTEISHLERSKTTADQKRADTYRKALTECEDYERDVLFPLASRRLSIDLDDGVLVNYLRFGEAVQKIPTIEKKRRDVQTWTWPTHQLTSEDGFK